MIAQLYFLLGTAEIHWNFSSIFKDGFDTDIPRSRSEPCIIFEICCYQIYPPVN